MIKILMILLAVISSLMNFSSVDIERPPEDVVIVQPEINKDDDVVNDEQNQTSENVENEGTENVENSIVDTETTENIEENQEQTNEENITDNEIVDTNDIENNNNDVVNNTNDTNDDVIDNTNDNVDKSENENGTIVEDTTANETENNTVVNNSNDSDESEEPTETEPIEEIEYLIPSGNLYNIDINSYSEFELHLITEMLKGIETIKNSNEPICVTIDVTDISNTYALYYKLNSFFYIYYGQEESKDLVFDMVNKTSNGVRSAYIQLRYHDIVKLEKELTDIKHEIDELLSTVIVGTEEEMLSQISKIVIDKIEYTCGYSDVQAALTGKSVCNGYALLFNMMCNRAGIKSDVCIGKVSSGEYHAWNRITLSDGTYRYFDTTWADTGNRNSKYLNSKNPLHGIYLINDYTDCWLKR